MHIVTKGRRGRRPLRVGENRTRLRNRNDGAPRLVRPTVGMCKIRRRAGMEPRPYRGTFRTPPTPTKRLRRRCGPLPHRRRQSIIEIKCRPYGAAASLFSIVSQDGHPRKIKRNKPSRAKTSCRRKASEGEAGGTHTVRRVLPAQKQKPLFFGAPPRFFGQGPKKWGGITTATFIQTDTPAAHRAGR